MRKPLILAVALVAFFAAGAGAQTLIGTMNGASEAPGPGDPDGFGLAGFRFEGTSVQYSMMVKNIAAPTASHIHRGTAGNPGPVVITLASSFPNNAATGTASASAALIDEIRRNPSGFYVNVHNADFPNGAIRSQLSSGAFAFATGAQEVPGPGDTDGSGMAVFTLSAGGATLDFSAMVQNIDAPTASHIHRGASTVAGPVVITLASSYPDNMATGSAPVPPNILDELIANPTNFYFNVHNGAFGGGAIRGALQLAPFAENYYFPVVGHADGVNNTRFVSDVRAVNTGTSPATVTLEYFASSPTGIAAATASKGVTVAPGAEVVLNDVVASELSATGLGALKIGASSALPTGVRVFNDLRPIDGGTTGFFIRPKGISEAAVSGTLLFLSQASGANVTAGVGFRTNIGWFNPNPASSGATFQARRASDGTVLGSVDVGIAGLSQLQQAVFSLISTVAAGDQAQEDFYVTWTSTLPIFVYGAVVDNRTGDVVYVD
jgi:hypothetical protein